MEVKAQSALRTLFWLTRHPFLDRAHAAAGVRMSGCTLPPICFERAGKVGRIGGIVRKHVVVRGCGGLGAEHGGEMGGLRRRHVSPAPVDADEGKVGLKAGDVFQPLMVERIATDVHAQTTEVDYISHGIRRVVGITPDVIGKGGVNADAGRYGAHRRD